MGLSNSTDKIIPRSKSSEWLGLDRISVIVHEMSCIWREQEKDDIGVDGEIELCVPRQEGNGAIGTGKIIKVQSKSGQHYVRSDQDGTFESPVKEKDLLYWGKLNVPIIYVVYHPKDDCLYWKDIQAYLRANPDAFEEPHRILFEKESDRFDLTALNALYELCKTAPERVDTSCSELLFPNFIEAIALPKQVFVSTVIPEKRSQFHQRLFGYIPPYSYRDGILTTLTNPSQSKSAFTNIIDSEIESFPFEEWLEQDPGAENAARGLLNGLIEKHLMDKGLSYQRRYRRFFYSKGLSKEKSIKKVWKSARTNRSPSRTVAQYYEYGKDKFFKHLALSARFQRYGKTWGIVIRPEVYYSTDGMTSWNSEKVKSYSTRHRSREYNNQYLNNVLFWSFVLSGGEPQFSMELDGQPIVLVKGMPEGISAPFGIRSIQLK